MKDKSVFEPMLFHSDFAEFCHFCWLCLLHRKKGSNKELDWVMNSSCELNIDKDCTVCGHVFGLHLFLRLVSNYLPTFQFLSRAKEENELPVGKSPMKPEIHDQTVVQ